MLVKKNILEYKVILAVSILVVTLTIANLSQTLSVGGLYSAQLASLSGVILFITTIAIAYGVMRYLLVTFFRLAITDIGRKSRFTRLLLMTVKWMYYTLLALLILIFFQMLLTSHYNKFFLVTITLTSSATMALAFALLGVKLITWYKSSPNRVVLLYALASLLLAGGTIVSIIVIQVGHNLLENHTIVIKPPSKESISSGGYFPSSKTDISKESLIFQIVSTPGRISLILYWIANVSLLRNYSQMVGKKKFWVIMVLPLILGFTGIFLVTLAASTSGTALFGIVNLTIIRISLAVSSIIDGFLNAAVFLLVSQAMKKSGHMHIENYLRSVAIGLIILPAATTIPQTSLLYPPFPLVSWSLAGIAAYFVTFGFYSTVISLSQDIKIRKAARSLVISNSKLLDSIGTAQIQSQLGKDVSRIVKEQEAEMEKHTEIVPPVSPEVMNSYLKEVIEELKSSRKKKIS